MLDHHNSATDGEVTPEVALTYAGTHDDNGNEIPDSVREVAAGRIAEAAAQNRQWKDNIGGLPVKDQFLILGQNTIHVPEDYGTATETAPEDDATGATGATGQGDLSTAPPPDPSTAQTPGQNPRVRGF